MVTLFCAVVGVAGSAFSVRVDESDSVDDLKDTIKAENEDIKGPARNLQLFLAKTEGGAWLPGDDSVPLQLDRGGGIDDVRKVTTEEQLKATWAVQDVLTANNMTAPKPRQIHVLAVGWWFSERDFQDGSSSR
ncbi:hypothetical protein KRP22_012131 [Phytophthora ramorum]|nr:Crinkler effector protein 115 [Phytophthora ramorum]KAH7497574.1 Crinkler effector protein 115 [Phytophthora ramorum]